MRKRYERAREDFGHVYAKFMSKRPKDPSLMDASAEVATCRRELHLASLDYAIQLNLLQDKKTVFVYQSLSNLVNCRLEAVEREADKLRGIKGYLDDLAANNIPVSNETGCFEFAEISVFVYVE